MNPPTNKLFLLPYLLRKAKCFRLIKIKPICSSSFHCQVASTSSESDKSKYILAMFPYPSGRLHMGHLRVYALSDVLSRYYALKGHKVLHPIGWDAFGLPAENAAIERGIDSAEWTYRNIEEMRAQLLRTGVKFNWDREVATCRPEYFRWTQWIFLQLYKHGFVRKAYSEVNWDPVDKTVLADEQVFADGRSWRSGALVEKRRLSQWVVDTPRYAKRLLDGLAPLEFEWQQVADIQTDWIGICDVFRFLLPINSQLKGSRQDEQLDLRIEDPGQFCSAQFVVLTKEHQIAKEAANDGRLNMAHNDDNDFVIFEDFTVTNFVTGRPMPLVVLQNEPSRETDYNIPFYMECRLGGSSLVDPIDRAILNHLGLGPPREITSIDRDEVLELAQRLGFGGYQTSRTLHDWVVSRQRAWGTPIPMLNEESQEEEGNNGAVCPIPEDQLPILGNQRGQRVQVPSFASGWGRIEMDTLDTYFDSSWYFLRFLDPHNQQRPFDPAIAHRQMPVDVYVGGVEHAKMHLFYARFINHFLYDALGLVPQPEPFGRFIPLGIVRSRSFQLVNSGEKYVPAAEVDGNPRLPDAKLVHRPSGEPVHAQYEKMSKSKHNGVDPLEMIDHYGADLSRLQLLFEARPSVAIDYPYPYPTYQTKNLRRWLNQVNSLVDNFVAQRQNTTNGNEMGANDDEEKFRDIYNRHVKTISHYLEILRYHNTALIRLIDMTRAIIKELELDNHNETSNWPRNSPELERCVHALIVMMQVFAPESAAQHWVKLQQSAASLETPPSPIAPWLQLNEPIEAQKWPPLDPSDTVDILLVVFGTLFTKSAPRKAVDHLDTKGLEEYAREQSHSTFFKRLQAKGLAIQSCRVECIDGLGIVLNLKMAENVAKRAITEIIQHYGREEEEGEKNGQQKRRRKKAKSDETKGKEMATG